MDRIERTCECMLQAVALLDQADEVEQEMAWLMEDLADVLRRREQERQEAKVFSLQKKTYDTGQVARP